VSPSFTYDVEMQGRSLLFKGKTDTKPVCIKFVQRYGKDVHLWCAEQGFAPKLLAFEVLPGGWYMVIMEHLDESWIPLSKIARPNRGHLKEVVHTALVALHQQGMVHGDLRDTNLLVMKAGGREFMLIDFDWAGTEGHVLYPIFVNKAPEIGRPADVDDDTPIVATHDDIMFEGMFH
jgi:serine/threonine protein kinase